MIAWIAIVTGLALLLLLHSIRIIRLVAVQIKTFFSPFFYFHISNLSHHCNRISLFYFWQNFKNKKRKCINTSGTCYILNGWHHSNKRTTIFCIAGLHVTHASILCVWYVKAFIISLIRTVALNIQSTHVHKTWITSSSFVHTLLE